MSERKSRQFWVVNYSGRPVEATGYECPPNDDTWWFPKLGFSTSAVHATRAEAWEAAVAAAEGQLDKARSLVNELKEVPPEQT